MKCFIVRDEQYPTYWLYEAESYKLGMPEHHPAVDIPEHLINAYTLIQEDYDDMQGRLEEYYNNAKETSKNT